MVIQLHRFEQRTLEEIASALCGGHPSHFEGVLSHALGVWASGLLGAVAATPLWLRDRRASLSAGRRAPPPSVR